MKSGIKMLLVAGIFPPEIGGPATYAMEMMRELPGRGIEVEALPFSSVRNWPKVLKHFIFFVKIIYKGIGKDVIFVQDTLSSGFPAVLAGIISRKKVILRTPGDQVWEQSVQRFGVKESIDEFQNQRYGTVIEFLRYLQKFSVRYATKVYAPSIYFSKLIARWNKGKKEIGHIYNGIDLNFKPSGDKFNKPTITTAGRLVSWKGVGALLELLVRLPEWDLIVMGDGPERPALELKARKLMVAERVRFTGSMPRPALMDKIYKSHIFILNSFFESFSFQVVEALYTGTPVVTTLIGNLPEIITHEENGVLVNPGDLDAIKMYVEKIMADEKFREKLSKNGKQRAQDFSIEKTMDSLAALIKSVVNK